LQNSEAEKGEAGKRWRKTMNGYAGRILHIDLSKQRFSIQNFDETFAHKFLGGNGFAAKLVRGVSRKDDRLPPRTTQQPIPSGPSRGMYCPPQEFNAMLQEYYHLRGWDGNGIPTPEKLKALGLEEVLKDLLGE
jgi:aldehyde:ferredoxin oxidoreductase